MIQQSMFQSTHSRRVRLTSMLPYTDSWKVSIHALTKSATDESNFLIGNGDVSIHALTKSATDTPIGINVYKKFQSTHSRRVRHFLYLSVSILGHVSIHALTKSATQVVLSLSIRWRCFNPRTHEECDLLLLKLLQLM